LSAWTFGDFEIYFRWAVTQGGRLRMLFPDVPSGKGLQLVLSEQDQCGRLTDGDTELAPGRKLTTRCGKAHTASVRREGGKFSVTIDGRWIYEVDVEAARRFGLGLAADGAAAGLSELRLREPPGERMFNGTDLTGWWTKGNLDHWRVERNQIVRFDRAGDYLRSEKLYANFTWSFEYKMERRGNSGLSIRTPKEGWPTADGMELQLLDTPYNAEIKDQPAMAVYGHVLPLARADMSQRWNRVVVKADGWMISAWMNGELVQQVNTFHHPELKHRRLKGWLGFQDHGAWIRVRNVHILEAPPGLGMAAWRKPRPPLGVTAILDRLINPERLSVADGITSAVVSKTILAEEPTEHVLADLTGPGAIVRIARGGDEGQLAFYFDGEKDPRIECKPGELQASLPPVAKNANPLLTCLTYKKRLRIVLRDAATAQYRFDYLKLPGNLPVESFADRESGFPRGWLPAATTILRWLGGGRFHEHDRLPRFSSDPVTIEPGGRAEMVHVDGAGIVKSMKLIAAGTVLDNNDLWLEVTIDGEKEPAVSAPARYLFPSLYGNYDNYVQADQGGPTTFLAMPFGEGITVAVANRGGRPIPGVGVSLSVQQAHEATKNEIAGRMRLRGVLQPAQEGTSELIRQEGSGRWVGLVYQVPEGEPAGIDTLLVDGRPIGDWSAPTLDPFLGESGDFRKHLSGRQGVLCWRHLLLAPVDFRESLVLKNGGNRVGERLVLFYLKK
ncbi:MAG: family 16 glycoside hydrolase, partial [Planctomycetota bacterium]